MNERNQGRRHSRNSLNSSQGARYAPFWSTAQNNLLNHVPTDRNRHGQLGMPASSRSLGTGAGDDDSQYYSDPASTFSETANMSATQLPYGSEYDPSGAEQQQTAAFGSYNASMMMYSVPQAHTQTSVYNPSPYVPSLPYRNNPITSTPLLSEHSDVSQSYFDTGVGATTTLDQHASVESTSAYYQGISSSFQYAGSGEGGGSSGDTGSTSGLTGVESLYQLADVGAGSAAMAEGDAQRGRATEFEEKWQGYQRRLAKVFQGITEGNLETAADELLSLSFWLLSQVEELGLTEDDELLHKDRLKLWQDFNNAWIGLVFKQKQFMTQDAPDIHLPEPLSLRSVTRMGDELVRLCDGIEKYGLVDYQLGVWEEKIEILLEDILNLYEEKEKRDRNEENRNV